MKTEPQNQTTNSATTASAPKRRMRRRRCPDPSLTSAPSAASALKNIRTSDDTRPCTKSDIENQKSEIPSRRRRMRRRVSNQKSAIGNQKSVRAHPFQPLPEFAHLRPDQLEYIHDLLRDSTLADVQQQLHMDLGVRLSSSTLHRYRAQLDLADQLNLGTDTATAIDQLRDLYAGRETNLDAAGLQVIKQRALALASAPKTSPTLLKDLHRIFTYEDRKQEKQQTLALRHAQRLELAHLREQTRLQISADRRATAEKTLAHRKDIDSQKLQLARDRHALELRKQEHREKIDARKTPEKPNNDQARENVEAIMAYGREYLRREREKDAANLAALTQNQTTPVENCQRIET